MIQFCFYTRLLAIVEKSAGGELKSVKIPYFRSCHQILLSPIQPAKILYFLPCLQIL